MTKRWGESGNIFFTLFGAVALVGVVGAATSTLMRGPVGTVVSLNQRAKADSQMQIAMKLAILEAQQRDTGAGEPAPDCDGDTLIEPMHPGNTLPGLSGGGQLPSVGSTTNDPWGIAYGYCGWDHGTLYGGASEIGSGCANGGYAGQPLLRGVAGASGVVIALVSAGPDRQFGTTCHDAPVAPAPFITRNATAGRDDIIVEMTYAEANEASGGLWYLQSGDPDKITTGKSLDVNQGAQFSGQDVNFAADTKFTGSVDLNNPLPGERGGLLLLPDQLGLTNADCNASTAVANVGALRRKTDGIGQKIQICDPMDPDPVDLYWLDVGGAGARLAAAGNANEIQFNVAGLLSSSATLRFNSAGGLTTTGASEFSSIVANTTLNARGATDLDSTLNVDGNTTLVGTLGVTAATTLSSTLGVTGDSTFTGELYAGNGTVTVPSYSFTGDPDTGIYYTSGGMGFAINGINQFQLTNGGFATTNGYVGLNLTVGGTLTTGQLDVTNDITANRFISRMASTSAALPAFQTEPGTGMYSAVDNSLSLVAGGLPRIVIDGAGDVGIGVTNPEAMLDVGGEIKVGTSMALCGLPLHGSIRYVSGDVLQVCSSSTNAWETIGTSGGGGSGAGSYWSRVSLADPRIYYNVNSVGIGTANPQARLQVQGDFIVSGTNNGTASIGVSGAGSRMFFDVETSAFRAGEATGTQWNNANIGNYSIGLGQDAAAMGSNSFAAGGSVSAQGNYSLALGRLADVTGPNSAIIGLGNAAGAHPYVSGTSSFGIFMGDQTGRGITANNTMALLGGRMLIDQTPSATNSVSGSLSLDVEGGVGALQYCDEFGANCFTASSIGDLTSPGANRQVLFNSNGTVATDARFMFSSAGNLELGGTGALKLPVGDVGNRPAGVNGMIRYNSSAGKFEAFQSGSWNDIITTGGGGIALNDLTDVITSYIAGGYNMYLGSGVGATATTAAQNTGLGALSMQALTTGNANTAVGARALRFNSAGIGNTAVGQNALVNTTGSYNSGFGHQALLNNTSGTNNTALGINTLSTNTSGTYNTAVGHNALTLQTMGTHNTALGNDAGANITTGNYNIMIGDTTNAASATGNYQLNIGNSITGDMLTGNLAIAGTGALKLPNGTIANRPASPVNGMIRYNDTAGKFEAYQGGGWYDIITSAIPGGAAAPDRGIQFSSNGNFAANANFVYTSVGRVGIGTNNPLQLLAVGGTIHGQSVAGAGDVLIVGNDSKLVDINVTNTLGIQGNVDSTIAHMQLGSNGPTISGYLDRLGVGTTTPQAKLQVNGSAYIGITNPVNSGILPNYGDGLHFLGGPGSALFDSSNSDPLYMARYNVASDSSQLRMIIGDNAGDGMDALHVMVDPSTTLIFARNDNRVGFGTATPQAAIDVAGTDAILFPRGIVGNRPAVPVNGMMRYNTATNKFEAYQGGSWNDIITTGGGGIALNDLTDVITNYPSFNMFLGNGGAATTTGTANTAVGTNALEGNTTGIGNTVLGTNSMRVNTVGNYNIAIGQGTMRYGVGISQNTAVGHAAMFNAYNGTAETPTYNVAIGMMALNGSATPANNLNDSNVAVGYSSMAGVTTGSSNVAVGRGSMAGITNGGYNVAVGRDALIANTVGNSNVSIGASTMSTNVGGSQNVAVGLQAMAYANSIAATTDTFNTALGNYALRGSLTASANTGNSNTALGFSALYNNTTGSNNAAIGVNSMLLNTAGQYNFAGGRYALGENTIGSYNVGIGASALLKNRGGDGSVAIGTDAMANANSNASYFVTYNTAVGTHAMQGSGTPASNTGIHGTAVGYNALYSLTSGNYSTAIGTHALYANTAGDHNTAIGGQAMQNNLGGNYNTALGVNALYTGTGGSSNVALGHSALFLASGNNNTAIGIQAGDNLTTGSYNIFIGQGVDASSPTVSNELNIGNLITGNMANGIVSIGSTAAFRTPVGTAAQRPAAVNGMIRYNTDSARFEAYENGSWKNMILTTGGGSGLDADTLDGLDSTAFGRYAVSGTWSALQYFNTSNSAMANATGNLTQLSALGTGGGAFMSFHRPGQYAAYFGLDSDNQWKVGGWSMGAAAYRVWHEGNDGAGSGLDADLLDGLSSASFMQNNVSTIDNLADAITDYPNGKMLLGNGVGAAGAGSNATALGVGSMQAASTGGNNTAYGRSTLGSNTVGANNTAIGVGALETNVGGNRSTAVGLWAMRYANNVAASTDTYNTAVGYYALRGSATAANNIGTFNTAIGDRALQINTSGTANTGVGSTTLANNSTGGANTTLGHQTLQLNTTGSDNTAVGTNAGLNNVAGNESVAIGTRAMEYANNSGSSFVTYNTAVGSFALRGSATPASNTGLNNTAVGHAALTNTTSGTWNTGIGVRSLTNNTGGYENTALGAQSMQTSAGGIRNVAVGVNAMLTGSGGADNTAIGHTALDNVSGNNNTALGRAAGNNITSGSNNIIIGSGTQASSATISNYLNIGNTISGDMGTGNINFGGTAAVKVPVGTTAQRPSPANGMIRYNADSAKFEVYENGGWINVMTGAAAGETDPQVANVNAGNACIGNGTAVDCSDSNVGVKDDITTRTPSGFWQSSTVTNAEGWPMNTNTWMHLLTSTHSNTANYYSMQFAGDFYDSRNIFYRATNGNGASGWTRMWTDANDGSTSGLDADLLDGVNSNAFAQYGVAATWPTQQTFSNDATSIANGSNARLEVRGPGGATAAYMLFHRPSQFAAYFGLDADNQWRVGGFSYGAASYRLWHEGNDGSGSGLDADLLDGLNSSSFMQVGSGTIDNLSDAITDYGNGKMLLGSGVGAAGAGSNATALGVGSMQAASTGGNNTAFGRSTLASVNLGFANNAFGVGALETTVSGGDNVAIGTWAMRYADSTGGAAFSAYNTAVGNYALQGSATPSANTGKLNTAIGYAAMRNNTTGNDNIAIGVNTLNSNTSGSSNVSMGRDTLIANTIGYSNTSLGHLTLSTNVGGAETVAVGSEALRYANPASGSFLSYNTAVGTRALRGSGTAASNTGVQNTAMGHEALANNTSGNYNTGVGVRALSSNGGGEQNTAFGAQALQTSSSGNYNVAIGVNAILSGSGGSDNVAVGHSALQNASGVGNIGLGKSAGANITSGGNNIIIGYGKSASSATVSNYLNIGDTISGDMATGNINFGGTAAIRVPNGGTGQRPGAAVGMIRYNTDNAKFEAYENGSWVNMIGAGAETDPQVAGTTAGNACIGTGSAVDCSDANNATRDDITLRVASGFFQDDDPTTAEGWPVNGGWYHLLSNTHNNAGNYYSQQFASDFGNAANLYYRVTGGNGASPWYRMWHAGNDGSGSGLEADTLDGYDSSQLGRYTTYGDWTAQQTFYSDNTGMGNASGGLSRLEVRGAGGGAAAFMTFHRPGAFASYFGLDSDNNWRVGGWSMGAASYRLWHEGNDGAGSGLDADLLDGISSAGFIPNNGLINWNGTRLYVNNSIEFVGTITDVSDRRLKDNIHKLSDRGSMLDKIDSIETYSFTMKSDAKKQTEFGVMAQELQKVFPELVQTDESTPEKYLSVNYLGMIGPMIEATKELRDENRELQAKVDTLEQRMASFENDLNGMKAHTGYGVSKAQMGFGMILGMMLMAMAAGAALLVSRRRKA